VAVVRAFVLALAWLAVAAIVAVGAAGVVASMNHFPGTPARAELTWAGDSAAEPALDAATNQLETLSDQVAKLSGTATSALTQVVGGDLGDLDTTIADGTLQLGQVNAEAATLADQLKSVPGLGAERELTLSGDLIDRYDALIGTTGLTDGLEANWAGFTGRALDAASVTGLLSRHDKQTADAAAQGSAGHYRKALDLLDRSDAIIAQARDLTDRLAKTSDVSTLSGWVERNATYDAALRDLYQSLLNSKGRVTDHVRRAFQVEQLARLQLPADTRAITVIMAEIAQGGLNQAVISIEQARGAISNALDHQRELQQGSQPSQAP